MNCELSNIDAIDEDVSSAFGLTDSFATKVSSSISKSGTGTGTGTGSTGTKFDWGSVISTVGGIAGGIIAGQQEKNAADRAAKAQREADQRASDRESKSQIFEMEKQKLLLEKSRLEADAAAKMQMMQQRTDGSGSGSGSGSGKFLGMPKAVGITVTVVGGLALIVGGILIVRKMRKK